MYTNLLRWMPIDRGRRESRRSRKGPTYDEIAEMYGIKHIIIPKEMLVRL